MLIFTVNGFFAVNANINLIKRCNFVQVGLVLLKKVHIIPIQLQQYMYTKRSIFLIR